MAEAMSTTPSTAPSDRHKYPGLIPGEATVLRQWLTLHQQAYTSFEYNVRIGPGLDPGPGVPDNIRQMAIENSQKRIDVVAWQGSQPTLIEVKERASLGASGQLIGYQILWNQEHANTVPPKLLIVARQVTPG